MEKMWMILQGVIVLMLLVVFVMLYQLHVRLDDYIAGNNQQVVNALQDQCRFNDYDDVSFSGRIPLEIEPETYIRPLVLNPNALPQSDIIESEVNMVLAKFIRNEDIIHFDSLSDLIMETLYVESKNGEFGLGSKNGQGMGQITIPTALYTLKTLQKSDKTSYDKIISLSTVTYPKNLDSIKKGTKIYDKFVNEVRHNLTFHVALMYHVYKSKDKKLLNHISTVASRASVWKEHYNTKAGAGTVEGYVKKTKEMYN